MKKLDYTFLFFLHYSWIYLVDLHDLSFKINLSVRKNTPALLLLLRLENSYFFFYPYNFEDCRTNGNQIKQCAENMVDDTSFPIWYVVVTECGRALS